MWSRAQPHLAGRKRPDGDGPFSDEVFEEARWQNSRLVHQPGRGDFAREGINPSPTKENWYSLQNKGPMGSDFPRTGRIPPNHGAGCHTAETIQTTTVGEGLSPPKDHSEISGTAMHS